jgi:hypothetical protein
MVTSLMSVFGAGLDTVLEVLLLNAAGVILAWYPIPEGLTASTASVRKNTKMCTWRGVVQGGGQPAPSDLAFVPVNTLNCARTTGC